MSNLVTLLLLIGSTCGTAIAQNADPILLLENAYKDEVRAQTLLSEAQELGKPAPACRDFVIATAAPAICLGPFCIYFGQRGPDTEAVKRAADKKEQAEILNGKARLERREAQLIRDSTTTRHMLEQNSPALDDAEPRLKNPNTEPLPKISDTKEPMPDR